MMPSTPRDLAGPCRAGTGLTNHTSDLPMLVLIYWELDPNLNPAEIASAVGELQEKGMWPPEGVKMLGWWITQDYWGVSVYDVDSEEALMKSASLLRLAKPGIFKKYKSSLAMPAKDVIPLMVQLNEQLKG